MAEPRAPASRTLLVYSPSDTERLFKIVNELPIPIKFLKTSLDDLTCEFYRYIRGRPGRCVTHGRRSLAYKEQRIIYLALPWYLQPEGPKRALTTWLPSNTRDLVIFKSQPLIENSTMFPIPACQAVIITSANIDAPEDRFLRCESRRQLNVSLIFTEPKPEGRYPVGKNLRIIASEKSRTTAHRSHEPQVFALTDAYRALNNTVDVTIEGTWSDVRSKRVDLHLSPVGSAFLLVDGLYTGAQYSPVQLCFFTSHRKVTALTFMDSWISLFWLAAILVAAVSVVTLYTKLRSRILFGNGRLHPRLRIMMFFAATFLGKGHSFSPADTSAFRNVATSAWVLGMMVLGNYLQSSITSIRTTPATVKNIKSFAELFRLIQHGAVCPCLNEEWRLFFYPSYDPVSFLRVMKLIEFSLTCDKASLHEADTVACYQRTRLGTHVALSVCTDNEMKIASLWDLLPGERYHTMVQAPVIHILNPLRHHHRRLLMATAEAGLAGRHQRHVVASTMGSNDNAAPLLLYLLRDMFAEFNGGKGTPLRKIIAKTENAFRLVRKIANRHRGIKEDDILRLIEAFVLFDFMYIFLSRAG
ncbi:hypothetical protein HPB50_023352 [Hyalomma asiaticum]|uniref:Uncharacterized protein n=1 Tax=Hyalomma asiaticum TaxID=266040 RepID=A0ACB7SQ82_HYAAI|nr:hypothetical protein HPB50_023352 [Hyalomma asiaticum]